MSDDTFTRVALVTGGNSGIGQAVALAFATAGAHVVIGARRAKEGEAVAKQIIAKGGQAVFVQSDVTRATDVQSLVEAAVKTFGRLDWAC